MRINSVSPYDLMSRYVNVRERVEPSTSRDMGVDRAELTSSAKTFSASLKAAKAAMDNVIVEREARVEELRNMIKEDKYHVPGSKVAEKIINRDL